MKTSPTNRSRSRRSAGDKRPRCSLHAEAERRGEMEPTAFGGFGEEGGVSVGGWDDADLDAQLAALDKRDAALHSGESPVNWKVAIEAEEDSHPGGRIEFPVGRPASGARERGLSTVSAAHGRRPAAAEPERERRPSAQSLGSDSRGGSRQANSRGELANNGRLRRDSGSSAGPGSRIAARGGRPPRRAAQQAAASSAASVAADQPLIFRMGATGAGAVVLRKVLDEAPNWVELEETEEALDGGLARSAPLKLPSLTDGRGRRQASAERREWNLTWRTGRFAPSEYENCNGSCRVNHIPKSSAICKKDNLVRHVRKARGVFGPIYNFVPTSFLVPTEYTKFCEHFSDLAERGEKSTWICKPTGMSRGRKIFLLDDISGLAYDRACVVQRYIPRPLLIGGYKMDIRLYVAVTSVRPLRAFIYQEGLARFSTEKYDMSDLSNVFSHLTNYSVNKNSQHYETEKDVIGGGAKWLFSRLLRYLEDHGHDTRLLWTRIRHICILTVLILMPLVPATASGCFELFGFDILVDEQLHPWLLEVNAAPALAAGEEVDWAVKEPLLRDLIGLLDFNNAGTHDALDRRKPKRQRHGGIRGARGASSSAGGSGSGSGSLRPNSRRQRPNGGERGARPSSRPDSAERLSEVSDSASQPRARSPSAVGRERFGGYELIFPFNDRMAELSEQCSEGVGGKVIAEHGKVVRQIVEEVRRMEEAAAVEAAGGASSGRDSDFRASGAGGTARRLLSRDIDTDPSLPGRKGHQEGRHRRMAALAGGLDDGSRGVLDSMPRSSAPGARTGRFDLAASLANTDAAIAALTAPSLPA